MKIINKNIYKILFEKDGLQFLNPNEVKDLDEKTAEKLLKHPNVEEFVAVEDVKNLEDENAALKKELELEKAKAKADKLGIKYQKNIGLAKLLEKIAAVENEK